MRLSLLVAAGVARGGGWVARDERRAQRDRDVATLTLALAAALAASPIVWVHYFLLLLVPLALDAAASVGAVVRAVRVLPARRVRLAGRRRAQARARAR